MGPMLKCTRPRRPHERTRRGRNGHNTTPTPGTTATQPMTDGTVAGNVPDLPATPIHDGELDIPVLENGRLNDAVLNADGMQLDDEDDSDSDVSEDEYDATSLIQLFRQERLDNRDPLNREIFDTDDEEQIDYFDSDLDIDVGSDDDDEDEEDDEDEDPEAVQTNTAEEPVADDTAQQAVQPNEANQGNTNATVETPCPATLRWYAKSTDEWNLTKCILEHSRACRAKPMNIHMTPRKLAQLLYTKIADDGITDLKALARIVRTHSNVIYSKNALYRAKQMVLKCVENTRKSFQYLKSFVDRYCTINDGSHREVLFDENDGKFKRMFMSLGAWTSSLLVGSRILFVDATFLHSIVKGTLLIAASLDANHNSFVVGVGIVEKEDDEAYDFFFRNLRKAIPAALTSDKLIFMTDRHASIPAGIRRHFSCAIQQQGNQNRQGNGAATLVTDQQTQDGQNVRGATHLYCTFHIYMNMLSRGYSGERAAEIFLLAEETEEAVFNFALNDIREHDAELYAYLVSSEIDRWAFVRHNRSMFGQKTNNVVESINSAVKKHKGKSFLKLLSFIIERSASYHNQTEEELMQKISVRGITNKAHEMLEAANSAGNAYIASASRGNKYIVRLDTQNIEQTDSRTVNLQRKTCTCGIYQSTRVPCKHAVAAFNCLRQRERNATLESFVSRVYHQEQYLEGFKDKVALLDESTIVPNTLHLPPNYTSRRPGRPRTERILSRVEAFIIQAKGRGRWQSRR